MKFPLVTIGAINFNNSRFVIETLDSIASQTYSNIELIIVDDCSTDDSISKIENWLGSYKKPFKLIVHKRNEGVHSGYEKVINNSSGDFISFIATDDLITPYKIEEQVNAFGQLDESYGIVYGDILEINELSEQICLPYFEAKKKLIKDWCPPSGNLFGEVVKHFFIYLQTALVRAELLRNFKFNYKALSEDYQVLLFLTRHSKAFGIDKVYSKYRKHTNSISTQNRANDKYHLWCLNRVYMFHEAYYYEGNSKQDKMTLENRMEYDLVDYIRQPKGKYSAAIKAWRAVAKDMSPIKALKILWMLTTSAIKHKS